MNQRAIWYQTVHAGFSAQQAKGVFALDLDGGTLDACRVARGLIFNDGLEAFALGIFEVLAQQHAGPVTSLSAARARLDIQKAIQRVCGIVEHAAELQPLNDGGQFGGLSLDGDQAGLVAVCFGHLEQFEVVRQFTFQIRDSDHHAVQSLLLFAQFLGAFGVVPDGRGF